MSGKHQFFQDFVMVHSISIYENIGYRFFTKNFFYEDKTIRLILWDTAGQELFRSLIPSCLKNADCIVILFDLTNKDSFISLNHWLKSAKDNAIDGTFFIVSGNKSDLKEKRTATNEEISLAIFRVGKLFTNILYYIL